MIARRSVIAGGAALPVVAGAQTARPAGRIGYLHPRTADPNAVTVRVLRPSWQRLGYVEGDSMLLRGAGGDLARLPTLARELEAAGCGALIVVGPSAVRATAAAVPSMPIVAIDLETDPVRSGLAQNYARPGGMVTGLFLDQPSLAEKWIALLREAVPGIMRLAIVWDPSTTRDQLESALDAARLMRIEARTHEARTATEIEAAFARMDEPSGLGVVHLGSPGFASVAGVFVTAALRARVPTISFLRAYAVSGVMITYGPNQESYFPRAIVLADRILRGEKPGAIPIERPSRLELIINARTAAALGLDLPGTFLAQADEVIE